MVKRNPYLTLLSWTNLALVVLGSSLFVFYRRGVAGLQAGSVEHIVWFIKLALIQSVLYFAAVWIVWRAGASRTTLMIVVVFAALFRTSILLGPPILSDDVYRYIWDGRVQAAGVNPYRYIPAEEELSALRDDAIYTRINRRENAHTIYPPVAQAFFFLVTRLRESVICMKAAMVACEGVAMLALMSLLVSFGYPRLRVLIFTWHPLLVWEIAGSGHVDALMIALVALALLARQKQKQTLAGIALGAATLVKFFPVVLFPALYRRWSWKMPAAFIATICLAYTPYLTVGAKMAMGFLPVYADQEGLESGERFFLLALARRLIAGGLPNTAYLTLGLGALAFMATLALWKAQASEDGYLRWSCLLAAAFSVLLSPHYAWYFAWLVPFMSFVPAASLLYLTAASFVLYGTWLGDAPERLFAINAALYLPFLALVGLALALRLAKRGSPPATERATASAGGDAI